MTDLRVRLAAVAAAVSGRERPRVAVVEWTDPLFSAGHWIPDMVTAAGGTPVLGASGQRSRPMSDDALAGCDAALIVVAPCGYNLVGAIELAAALLDRGVLPPGVPVYAVDADAAFVRPGPRLLDGIEALAALCHPEAVAPRPELASVVSSTSVNTKPSRSTVSPIETARA